MKILIVSPFVPPRIGGIERHTSELAKSLTVRGFDVHILTSEVKNQMITPIENIQIHKIKSSIIQSRLPVPNLSRKNISVFKKLKQIDFHVVVIQSHLFPISVLSGFFFSRSVSSVIWINHGSGYVPMKDIWSKVLIRVYENFMMRILRNYVTKLVSVSSSSATWLESKIFVKSVVVPNGVPSEATRYKLSKVDDQVKVIFVGRLVQGKGAHESLLIFQDTIKNTTSVNSRINCSLSIVGNGPERENIKYAIGNSQYNINLQTNFSHYDVIRYMSDCQIFLYPSRYPEGLPTAVLEALALGLVVITNKKIAELQPDLGKYFFICGSHSEYIEKLDFLIQSPELRFQRGNEAREYVLKNYNWHSLADRIIE